MQEAHLTANNLGKFERKVLSEQRIDQRVPSGQALLGSQSITVKVPIPSNAVSTSHGAIIECFSVILVRLRLQQTCLQTRPVPEISTEVVISPETLKSEAFDWGEWSPVEMPTVNLDEAE